MPSIDNLYIELGANAVKANDSIDRLIDKVGRLSTSISGLNTSNLTGLANGVQRLSNSMQSMKSVGTADFTRLAKNLNNIGSVNTANLNRLASSVNQLSKSFRGLQNVQSGAKAVSDLANSIRQFGNASTTRAIANIPLLANSLKNLMQTLSTASRVSNNLIQMTNALAKLSRTGGAAGTAANSLVRSFNTVPSATSKAKSGFTSLASAIGKVYATYWLLFRAFGKISQAMELASNLTEVENVIDHTFGSMRTKLDTFTEDSIEKFGLAELAAKQYAGRFQAMGVAMGISNNSVAKSNQFLNEKLGESAKVYGDLGNSMADLSVNLTKLTSDYASFFDVAQSDVAEDFQSIFTGQTKPLRTYGLDLTNATLKEWALNNGLNANINSMTQAEKAMLRYQYVMANSSHVMGDFARTSDTWHNTIVRLKNNFQALGTTVGKAFINLLKPIAVFVNNAIVGLNKVAVAISNALGKLLGWEYEEGSGGMATEYEDAADYADDMADGTGKAAKAAKELKKQLQGIDELNVLTTNNDTGTGGGSGSGAGTGGADGTTGTDGSWVKRTGLWDTDVNTWKDLGNNIRDGLITAMGNIKWNEIYQKAANFGSGLAEFLNGLFEGSKGETLFGSLGTTVAGALNTAFKFLNSFGETFEWEQFGQSVADGINNFFSTFDFKTAAEAISKWVKGALKSVATLFKQTDFEKIGEKIGEFLKELDIGGMAGSLSEVLWEAVKSSFDLLKGMFEEAPLETSLLAAFGILKFSGIGSKVATKIAESIVGKVATSSFATSISSVATTVGTTLTTAFTTDLPLLFGAGTFAEVATAVVGGLLGALVAAFAGFKLGEWLSENNVFGIGDLANHIVEDMGLGDIAVGIIDAFEDMAEDGVGGFFKKCGENLKTSASWLADKFKVVVGAVANKVKEFAAVGKAVITFLKNGITDGVKSIGTWIKSNVVDKIVAGFDTLKTGISNAFSLAWEGAKTIWSVVSEWFITYILTPINTIFTTLKDGVVTAFSLAWEGAKIVWSTVSDWFNQYIVTPITQIFTTLKEIISNAFSTSWNTAKGVWNTVKGWFDNNIKTPLTNTFNTVKTNVGNAFSTSWNTAKGVWNTVKGWFDNNIKTPLTNTFNTVKTNVGNAFSNAWSSVKSKWEGAKDWFENSVTSKIKDKFGKLTSGKESIVQGFGDAVDGIKKKFDNIGKIFGKIAKNIFSPIKSAINGIIKGINWVLDKVGVGKSEQLSLYNEEPNFDAYAKGSNGLPRNTIGMVNDQKGSTYREMIVPPNGKPFIPEGRNVILPMQKGTKIMPANQTKEFLRGIPHFEGGIGEFFGGVANAVKSFTGDVMDYLSEPAEAVKIAIGKFANIDSIGGVVGDIAKGAANTVFDGAVEFVKKIFDSTTAAKVENAIKWAVNIANDNRHGYDQGSRWGTPDYDCSSLVISAFEQAGIKLKSSGATYTGNMESAAIANGFKNVISSVNLGNAGGMKRGDILLNKQHHTAIYLGNGQIVQASSNEFGRAVGGQPGDQTGREIATRGYYNYPWDAILRFSGKKFAKGFGKITPMDFSGYYAAGGFPDRGTIFVAGERGTEVVGNINGQTEVLNHSQIAKVMYDAVMSANAQQNQLLQQQNDYLYQILQKETGISYKDVFEATRKGADEYQLMHGVPAFI